MIAKQLEYAAFSAWPALEQTEYNGVVLRFAHGYTKRANSANILDLQTNNYPHLVKHIENYFKQKKQPSIIRIPSFTLSDELDSYLANNGYQFKDKSLVLDMPLHKDYQSSSQIVVKDPKQWMQSFCNINNSLISQHQAHLQILERIEDKILPVVLMHNDLEIGCALGVLHKEYFGIFDLVTHVQFRGQGCGYELVNSMLDWAVKNGASHSYLQVVANNLPAINLYKKLGYQQCYEYWYRVKD